MLPEDAARREYVEARAREILGAAGYRRIETPTFEATELFARGVGEATDIVQKEMYTFDDGGGRSLTLRPEGTAPVCRAYIEHGMHKLAAAGQALVPVELLPRRGAAAGPLPAVLAGRSRGDRLRRPRDRRRADRAARRPARGAVGQGRAAAALEPRHPRDARGVPRGAARTCAATRTGCPTRSARASTSTRCGRSTPPIPGTREVMRDAPSPARSPRRRGRRALRAASRRCSTTRPPLRARPDARARPRLLHADGVRVHERCARRAVGRRRRRSLRRPDRAARRPADARFGVGGRRRADAARRRRAADRARARRPVRRAANGDRPAAGPRSSSRTMRAAPGWRPSSSSPAARSRDSSSKPIGSARATSRSSKDPRHASLKDMESGEQREIEPCKRDPRHPPREPPLMKHCAASERVPRRLGGQLTAERAGTRPASRLGAPPPRPRRADLHRPP